MHQHVGFLKKNKPPINLTGCLSIEIIEPYYLRFL
ncbi:MAG: hypothetical protein JWP78_2237 [Mucilaginibacter sp.]|nr:hypothetical protein [Mucilaginibacter sp.]